ncbi:MAG: CRISPR-associated endonuclease Cas1, partial [Chloroflexi bacterium]|nr:CRISPR-associated endonuclease Cas1 [Chloroflexota bacterium]
ARVVDLKAFQTQTARPRKLNERLWHEMLRGKTLNQARVLQHKQLRSPHLELALKHDEFDEANCARRYWQLYFPSIGWSATRRDRKENTAPNQMLNYGYAVLATLCHRGLIIHGLLPQLGVHHKPRYRADPLVYDLMESFRPAVELMLAEFMLEPDVSMKAWAKKVGTDLRERRVKHGAYTLKLMDAIDASANSLARAYAEASHRMFWVPELPEVA